MLAIVDISRVWVLSLDSSCLVAMINSALLLTRICRFWWFWLMHLSFCCSDRGTNNPVGQQKSTHRSTNQPVSYSISPLLGIGKITLFGTCPTPLGNEPLG